MHCIDIDIGEECYGITSGIISIRNCIDIDIGDECYGITSGIISIRNNIVMALDSCPKCSFAQYLKNE